MNVTNKTKTNKGNKHLLPKLLMGTIGIAAISATPIVLSQCGTTLPSFTITATYPDDIANTDVNYDSFKIVCSNDLSKSDLDKYSFSPELVFEDETTSGFKDFFSIDGKNTIVVQDKLPAGDYKLTYRGNVSKGDKKDKVDCELSFTIKDAVKIDVSKNGIDWDGYNGQGEIDYTINDDEQTVSVGAKGMTPEARNYSAKDLVIPRKVWDIANNKSYLVTSIRENGFYESASNTLQGSLTIPNTVKSIGNNAFYVNFQQFVNGNLNFFPENITNIGTGAFDGCQFINESFTIPGNWERISADCFHSCLFSGPLTLKDGVKYIDDSAFHNCKKLSKINIPKTTEQIGAQAFYNCEKVSEINIWNPNVFTFGNEAFEEVGNQVVGASKVINVPIGSTWDISNFDYLKDNHWTVVKKL